MTKTTKCLMLLMLGLILNLVVAANVARADTWTFHDETDALSATHIGTAYFNSSCYTTSAIEQCSGEVYRFGTLKDVPGINHVIGSDGTALVQHTWYSTKVLEADGGASDRLYTYWWNVNDPDPLLSSGRVLQYFYSDIDKRGNDCVTLNCYSATPLRDIYENGRPQLSSTVYWNNGTVDTSYFVSDVTGAPEPSSLMLLATSLVGLGAIARRKIAS